MILNDFKDMIQVKIVCDTITKKVIFALTFMVSLSLWLFASLLNCQIV